MAVQGDDSIRQVAKIFNELGANAKIASTNLGLLAGAFSSRLVENQKKLLALSEDQTKANNVLVDAISATSQKLISFVAPLQNMVNGVKSIGGMFTSLLTGISKFVLNIGAFSTIILGKTAVMGKFGAAVEKATQSVQNLRNKMAHGMTGKGGAPAAGAGAGIAGLIRSLIAPLRTAVTAIVAALGTTATIVLAVVAALAAMVAGLYVLRNALKRQFFDAIVKFTTPLINGFDTAKNTITNFIGTISSFVGKLNPALVEQLDIVMNNLMATIGRALLPIFRQIIPIVESFSDVLDFGLTMMTPIFQAFANAMKMVAIPALNGLIAIFDKMQPVIELITGAINQIGVMFSNAIQEFVLIILQNMPAIEKAIKTVITVGLPLLANYLEKLAGDLEIWMMQLENSAKYLEAWGDTLIYLDKIFTMVGQGFSIAWEYIKMPFIWLGNAINATIDGLFALINWLNDLPVVGGFMDGKLQRPTVAAAEAIGLPQPNANFMGRELPRTGGAATAATGASFQGIGELGKNVMAAAFGGAVEPAERTANGVEQMVNILKDMLFGQQNKPFQGNAQVQGVR